MPRPQVHIMLLTVIRFGPSSAPPSFLVASRARGPPIGVYNTNGFPGWGGREGLLKRITWARGSFATFGVPARLQP